MSKETWIQHDSYEGKNFRIEKKVRDGRIDIFVSKDGDKSDIHDHGIITPNFTTYIDRGTSKR